MIILKINYKCLVCNKESFYFMPMDKKTKSGDYISSETQFLAKCRNCKQKYMLQVNIGVLS